MEEQEKTIPSVGIPESNRRDVFYSFLLTICFGIYFFICLLWWYGFDGIVESEEFKLFVLGWILVPPASLAAAFGVGWLRRRACARSNVFYPVLLLFNAVNVLLSVLVLLLYKALFLAVLLAPAVNLLALLLICALQKGTGIERKNIENILGVCLILVAFPFVLFFVTGTLQNNNVNIIVASVLALGCAFIRLPSLRDKKRLRVAIDCAAAIAAALMAFDANLHVSHFDYAFFLGPVNEVMHGRTMLVDVNCQYGVGIVYALAAFFQWGFTPMTYSAFAALITGLYALEYIVIYLLLRTLTRSLWAPALGIALVVVLNNYSTADYASSYPSTGPLRFGMSYLLLGAVLGRQKWPGRSWIWNVLEGLVVGVASIWSLETMTYVIFPFIAMVVYEIAAQGAGKNAFRAQAARVATAIGFVALAHGLLVVFTFLRSGQFPHWSYYFAYILIYTKAEFGTQLIVPWTPWVFIPLIYLASLIALTYRIYYFRNSSYTDGALVMGLSTVGVTQFIYFVGRSHVNNLYHVSVPAICLACYWLAWAFREKGDLIAPMARRGYAFLFSFAAISIFWGGLPQIRDKAPQSMAAMICSMLRHPRRGQLAAFVARVRTDSPVDAYQDPPEDALDAAVLRAIGKYFKYNSEVPMLINPPSSVFTLFQTGKNNAFLLGCATEDELDWGAFQRILAAPLPLKTGDILLLQDQQERLEPLQWEMLKGVRKKFKLVPVEPEAAGLTVCRVEALE